MCTSLVVETTKDNYYLARTMDFTFELEGEVIVIPKGYAYDSVFNIPDYKNYHGFVGTGRNFPEGYIFADGVNDAGLSCASLYFPEYATYAKETAEGKINLAPHEVVYFLLSSFSSVEDVKKAFKKVNLVDKNAEFIGFTLPLHWVISDKKGNSIIVEPTIDGIKIYENKIGVMTNSPDYNWHMTNLRNYIGIQSKQIESMTLCGIEFKPFGQGLGTRGLPGDYTPPSRFVRGLYAKTMMPKVTAKENGVYEIFHALSSVNVPKGSVKAANNASDYTQYVACMSNNDLTYYTQTYYGYQIKSITLTEELLKKSEPTHYEVLKMEYDIRSLN